MPKKIYTGKGTKSEPYEPNNGERISDAICEIVIEAIKRFKDDPIYVRCNTGTAEATTFPSLFTIQVKNIGGNTLLIHIWHLKVTIYEKLAGLKPSATKKIKVGGYKLTFEILEVR